MCEKEGRKCESGITIDYLEQIDSENKRLSERLKGKTIVKEIQWTSEKSDDDIARVCEGFALDIKSRKHSVYDFWMGTDGIGE